MKILSIGNSFSSDATTYLHALAAGEGQEIETVNLYIGGCSLEKHWNNVLSKEQLYVKEVNGIPMEGQVSINEVLNDEFDIVTFQQVSNKSVDYQTYEPYLTQLIDYVRSIAKHAKLILHKTWAYTEGTEKLIENMGYQTTEDMSKDIEKSYNMALRHHPEITGCIPCNEVFCKFENDKYPNLHRDDLHASIPFGRYILACVWFTYFEKCAVKIGGFCPKGMDEIERKNISNKVNAYMHLG